MEYGHGVEASLQLSLMHFPQWTPIRSLKHRVNNNTEFSCSLLLSNETIVNYLQLICVTSQEWAGIFKLKATIDLQLFKAGKHWCLYKEYTLWTFLITFKLHGQICALKCGWINWHSNCIVVCVLADNICLYTGYSEVHGWWEQWWGDQRHCWDTGKCQPNGQVIKYSYVHVYIYACMLLKKHTVSAISSLYAYKYIVYLQVLYALYFLNTMSFTQPLVLFSRIQLYIMEDSTLFSSSISIKFCFSILSRSLSRNVGPYCLKCMLL